MTINFEQVYVISWLNQFDLPLDEDNRYKDQYRQHFPKHGDSGGYYYTKSDRPILVGMHHGTDATSLESIMTPIEHILGDMEVEGYDTILLLPPCVSSV